MKILTHKDIDEAASKLASLIAGMYKIRELPALNIYGVPRGGIPVAYLLYPDEGHGFARPENNIAFRAVAENFLARHLGGRAEPIHPKN